MKKNSQIVVLFDSPQIACEAADMLSGKWNGKRTVFLETEDEIAIQTVAGLLESSYAIQKVAESEDDDEYDNFYWGRLRFGKFFENNYVASLVLLINLVLLALVEKYGLKYGLNSAPQERENIDDIIAIIRFSQLTFALTSFLFMNNSVIKRNKHAENVAPFIPYLRLIIYSLALATCLIVVAFLQGRIH